MIRTITVKGVGTASVKPDYITLTMTIETQDKSYNKAMLDASKRIEMIQKAVEGIGYVSRVSSHDSIKTKKEPQPTPTTGID